MPRFINLLLIFLASPALVPITVITAILVWLKLGSPILYKQRRGGLDGKVFTIWKFRSMTDERDLDGSLLPDTQRLTAFGKALRSSSLDELPCVWNVLTGEMSLVGPRPFIADYLSLYTKEQFRRHAVRPGITGWAQIKGRNALTWEEKFALDIWYVENKSFWLDVVILLQTIKKVFQRHGVSADGEATMPRFRGTKQ